MNVKTRRCLLFVPGSRPDRFDKALGAGADLVCIDLEDAVQPEHKAEARRAVIDYLQAKDPRAVELVVRVNGVDTAVGEADLAALRQAQRKPDALMLPKTETAADVEQAHRALDGVELFALIESPRGILNAERIAAASDRLGALMFGGADYAAELGADMAWEPLYHARGHLAVVAAAARLDLIDVPYLDIADEAGLEQETRRVKAMGFTCKAVIHPTQVAAVNAVFTPTEHEIERAERILEAFAKAGGGAVLVDGKMVDRPVVKAAERVIAIAQAAADA